MTADLITGATFRVAYPFIRDAYTYPDEDGYGLSISWKPGLRGIQVPAFEVPDIEEVADGMGEMILTVVSTHKPGRFPLRVFFTRQWVTPDGREFGKTKCRIATAEKFRRLANGFGVRDWRMATPEETDWHIKRLRREDVHA